MIFDWIDGDMLYYLERSIIVGLSLHILYI